MLHQKRRTNRVDQERARHRGGIQLPPGLLGDATVALEHAGGVDQQTHIRPATPTSAATASILDSTARSSGIVPERE